MEPPLSPHWPFTEVNGELVLTRWRRLIPPLLPSCYRIKVIWVLLLFSLRCRGTSLAIWPPCLLSLQNICGRGFAVEASNGNCGKFQAIFIIVMLGWKLARSSWPQVFLLVFFFNNRFGLESVEIRDMYPCIHSVLWARIQVCVLSSLSKPTSLCITEWCFSGILVSQKQ